MSVHHLAGGGGKDHLRPGHGSGEGLAVPQDGHLHVGAALAGDEQGQGLAAPGLLQGGAVYRHDGVPHPKAGLGRRRVGRHAGDHQALLAVARHDADAHHGGIAEGILKPLIFLRRHVVGVGIAQGVGDLLDGRQGQNLLVDGIDVALAQEVPGLLHGDGPRRRRQDRNSSRAAARWNTLFFMGQFSFTFPKLPSFYHRRPSLSTF